MSSTNDFLKSQAAFYPTGTYVRTDYQTAGRGQFDRVWESKARDNLLCSFIIKNWVVEELPTLKQWIIDSLISLLSTYQLLPVVKQPNDIYVQEKKIVGILIETKIQEELCEWVIIGIGLNVNQQHFVTSNATSMCLEIGQTVDLDLLESRLIQLMESLFPGKKHADE